MNTIPKASGLDGVVAANTVLSHVDGEAGRLIIRGHDVEEFAAGMTFEGIVGLLWSGLFDELDRAAIGAQLGKARAKVFERLNQRVGAVATMEPIEALRALIAALPDGDDLETAMMLAAAPGVLLPAVLRVREGKAAIAPDPGAKHAADMLRMLGQTPDAERAAALNAYLAVVSDHGFNASTFAARVVASTLAGLTSAVVAGISALKGPLHGGAPGPIIAMLDAIGEPGRAEQWLVDALARGERLMGFGHRIYRVRDPRADALKQVVTKLARRTGNGYRLAFAESVEAAALAVLRRHKPDRPLDTNVEFYTALLLEALGFPADAFTCVFAAGRVAGWIAHAREQVQSGRLIRPQSHYVGPMPSLAA